MKLLFCDVCQDVFKLGRKLKTCDCGRVKGKYEKNGHNAVVNGKGYSVAIGNGSFIEALYNLQRTESNVRHEFIDDCRVEYCWIRPHTGPGNPRTIIQEDL